MVVSETTLNPLKEMMDQVATQLISFIIVMAIAYFIPLLIIRLIKVPWFLAHIISVIIMCIVTYFAFMNIFLMK
ncbi:hypothetical protein H9650_00245 [Psychrobacillus sp. Sa2BUA9]|uniref:Uncharacterized protein n=1 Tax=Psychrobacillus faecigallinarum TaxID=2762235 RepID=A0ABR8R438_9BACI|nr:hypothetical protein [Psychrobacillus faecigallinarum]MBD7942538.1 hypothetical protein [Psychrobacillus faecigallinarum]